jgi:hypothetical protein
MAGYAAETFEPDDVNRRDAGFKDPMLDSLERELVAARVLEVRCGSLLAADIGDGAADVGLAPFVGSGELRILNGHAPW